jgi:hypothetical protein
VEGWRIYVAEVDLERESWFAYKRPRDGARVLVPDVAGQANMFRVTPRRPLWHVRRARRARCAEPCRAACGAAPAAAQRPTAPEPWGASRLSGRKERCFAGERTEQVLSARRQRAGSERAGRGRRLRRGGRTG